MTGYEATIIAASTDPELSRLCLMLEITKDQLACSPDSERRALAAQVCSLTERLRARLREVGR